MVWGALKRKLTEHVVNRLEETQNDLSTVKTEVRRRHQRVDNVEQQLDELEEQIAELSQTVDALHAWDIQAHRKLESHEKALTDLTDMLSTHLPPSPEDQAATPETPSTTPEKPSKRPSKRATSRPDERSKRPDDLDRMADLWSAATPAQKEVLMVLYEAGYPLSYREIASELERSVSTVKNHVNTLKSKGFPFEEQRGSDNAKRYALDERIRSFLAMKIHA